MVGVIAFLKSLRNLAMEVHSSRLSLLTLLARPTKQGEPPWLTQVA